MVEEIGYSTGDYGEVVIGFVVTNPNQDQLLENVSLQMTVRDADGVILDTDPEFKIGDLLPGETFGMGTSLFVDDVSKVSTVEVEAMFDGSEESDALNPVSIVQINAGSGGYGYVGEVSNEGDADVDDALVGFVVRDGSGAIVGGGFTDVMDLPAGGSLTFDAPYVVAEGTTVEPYGHVYY